MPRPARLTIALTALVAFMVTGLMPAAGSWSCPDGTVCAYTPGRGFHCPGDECRVPACGWACCVGKKTPHGCGRCDHGSLPVAQAGPRSRRPSLHAPEQCRYHEPVQAEKVIARPSVSLDLHGPIAAMPPAPAAAPVAAGFFLWTTPIRGSPPSSRVLPTASPRAPPELDCA